MIVLTIYIYNNFVNFIQSLVKYIKLCMITGKITKLNGLQQLNS